MMLLQACSTCRIKLSLKKRRGHSFFNKRRKARVIQAISLEVHKLAQQPTSMDKNGMNQITKQG
jgi:hypothetical protein